MIAARAAGDAGLLIETDAPSAWLAAAIGEARLPGVVEVVPGAATVLVLTEPGAVDLDGLATRIAALPLAAPASGTEPVVEIPVRYDGPDLADVARLAGLSVDEVITAHAGALYTVGWLGFCPGFGYLTGLDQRLSGVTRLPTPRVTVPAGSVAIAAGLAAIYPSASPGGWRLLGRTSLRLWDTDRDPAALLAPGRHVKFVASDLPIASDPLAGHAAGEPHPAPAPGRPAAPCLEVIKPGPLATVQDLGRRGLGAIGVPPSGAADPVSLIAANRLVGNPDAAAGLELTLGHAAFRCHGDLAIAVCGAPTTVTVDSGAGGGRQPVGFGSRIEAADGSVIGVAGPATGLRCYVAVAGGISVLAVLGSRSSDLLSGLGCSPLQPGAILPIGSANVRPVPPSASNPISDNRISDNRVSDSRFDPVMGVGNVPRTGTQIAPRGEVAELRVMAGPRLDWFEADSLDRLCSGVYIVTAASNRTGLRLDGEPMRRSSDAELPSEGMVTGSLQVPPDGRPILLLADHPTVGGYPVIAVVVSADIGLAAQLRPGDRLRFRRRPA